ncbi:PREDICTED: disks large-associated protein 5 isoform X2 [Dinoponera quadriceps]|uniref:Disks large-associated protein 5 isoform X2 n=1 Tax=Dinoponera quadriceps TaxID=609295 RepID=A0A6P3XNI9_DINQU|nr:PREDICTED: disks large-associated protein 5 isoform X2 [Dinoponera quadriceps]
MSHLQQRYKNPRRGFGDADHSRSVRAYYQEKSRKEIRTQDFAKNRKLHDVSTPTSPQREDKPRVTGDRAKKLMRWKEERDRKKKLENSKKKPVFKVGVVHHSLYSPVAKINTAPDKIVKSSQAKYSNDKKRITRATEKRLLAKAAMMKQKAPATNNIMPVSSTRPLDIKKPTPDKFRKSFAPNSHKFRPPSGLPKLPLFGVVAIEETPSEKGIFFENKSGDQTQHTNDQKDASGKLNTQDLDLNAASNRKDSVDSKSPANKQKLNESDSNLSDSTSELKETKNVSLNEQDIQEEKSLSTNIDTENSVQMTPKFDQSFMKENCEDLIMFSPYLTLSRGKKNARKEQMLRLGISNSPSTDIPTKNTVMKNLNISVEEEERTAQYFKFLLNREITRLKELCTKWMNIRLEKGVPEDAMYEISQAVGQTNLLMNKKFERFRNLVSDCETGKGQMLVTCKDLQGFWDITYMEVRNCDLRFEKLEQQRNREWQEEQSAIVKPATKKRMTTKKQIVSSKPSSLRSIILAARRKKMAETSNIEDTLLQNPSIGKEHLLPSLNSKRSIAFKENADIRHTRKSISIDGFKSAPTKRDSFKANSTKIEKVQFSDKITRMKSPLTVMKISQMCKTPEIQLDDTISYINSDQTPGKSILKKTEIIEKKEIINKEIRLRSAHKVLFDDQVASTEADDKETQIKKSLSVALNRIDSLELDDISPEECINVERKLIFETEDSDSTDSLDLLPSEVQTLLEKKRNTSKSSASYIPDSDPLDPLKDITSAIALKEPSPKDNVKTKCRTSLRRRSQRKRATNNGKMETPYINIMPPTPANTETPVNLETTFTIENLEQELEVEVKTLRNRTITINDTPKTKRMSKIMTPKKESDSKKENESPVKSNRRKSLKLSQIDEDVKNVEINKNSFKKRRSSRKSVAFNVETCLICAENKPVLPMTPHSKRGTPSRQSRSKRVFDENLSLQRTPRSLSRVTRSHTKN